MLSFRSFADAAQASAHAAAKVNPDLISDLASAMALHRGGADRAYHAEAERCLRLFIAQYGRHPQSLLELGLAFPSFFTRDVRPQLAAADELSASAGGICRNPDWLIARIAGPELNGE